MKTAANAEPEGSTGRGPPRILFIATDLSTGGGVNKAIRDQAALLSERLGAEISVVNARSDRPSTYTFPADVPVEQHRAQSLLGYFRLLLRLCSTRPDFVVGSWTQDNLLVTLAFLFSRTRVVLVEHTSWHFHSAPVRLLRRIVYPLAWRVIVLNPTELRHYRRFLSNVRLLPNVVSVDRAEPSHLRREKLILAVGHLEPRKNFAAAVRAMGKSSLEEHGWSLAIVGAGPEENSLRQLIGDLGLRRTTIHPPTSEIDAWYARASLTLVTAKLEVFSLVLAEAMLAGVVPISYAADGPAFILQDFPEHLVPIDDIEGLSRRLVRFANEPGLEPLSARMRAAIEKRFSPEVIGAEWQRLLTEEPPCQ